MAYSDEVLADTPLVYMRLGGADSTAIKVDSSGNSRTATTTLGTLTYWQLPLITADLSCKFTNPSALHWNNAAWMNPTSITLEAWINCTGIGVSQYPAIWDRYHVSYQTYFFRINPAGKLEFVFRTASAGPFTVTGATTLTNGTTYHVAATYDSATGVATIYVNGVSDATLTVTADAFKSTNSPLHLGASYGGGSSLQGTQYFSGRIDEAAQYGSALASARILAHYNAGVEPSTAVRFVDSFEVLGVSSGSATRHLDSFEVVVVSSITEAAPTNDLWVWDGATEVPANVTVWNGTVELPSSIEFV